MIFLPTDYYYLLFKEDSVGAHDDLSAAACYRCSRERNEQAEMLAERMDLWKAASNLIKTHGWPEDSISMVDPSDVLDLARFLAGELDV